jgi:hypothetical protein
LTDLSRHITKSSTRATGVRELALSDRALASHARGPSCVPRSAPLHLAEPNDGVVDAPVSLNDAWRDPFRGHTLKLWASR